MIQPASRHYDANYGNFETDLYAEIRREAFGEDIGQSSWISADEQDRFLPLLNLAPGKTLLDIACGSGGPAMRIVVKTGCSLVGVDVHGQAVSTAASLAAQRGMSALTSFRQCDATVALSFPDASFDAITCIDAINHLPDRPRVLADWTRLLKPGGRMLFTNPCTITGSLSNAELAVRSSIGFFLFVPAGYDRQVIAHCGLRLVASEDVTENMAVIAQKRMGARASRGEQLRAIEGESTFEAQQQFFAVATLIARERRLSRFVYVAEKIA